LQSQQFELETVSIAEPLQNWQNVKVCLCAKFGMQQQAMEWSVLTGLI